MLDKTTLQTCKTNSMLSVTGVSAIPHVHHNPLASPSIITAQVVRFSLLEGSSFMDGFPNFDQCRKLLTTTELVLRIHAIGLGTSRHRFRGSCHSA